MSNYRNELEKLYRTKTVFIYGAGDVATEVGYCLMHAPYNKTIEAFVISESNVESGRFIFDIPVISMDSLVAEKESLFIIAVLERYRDEIYNNLKTHGFENILCLTFESDLWAAVRGEGFLEYCKHDDELLRISGIDYLNRHDSDQIINVSSEQFRIYVAKSHKDRKLHSQIPTKDWEIDIQVGAELTSERITDTIDCQGINISAKNSSYCELTALYWMWKNADADYMGLSHYRRRFDLNQKDVSYIIQSDIDVVATIPILNIPDVRHMYAKNHLIEDWSRLKEAIRILAPDYMEAFCLLEEGKYYFAYNMFIMKRQCLNDYCEWLFPILEYCETNNIQRDTYQSRYIGFLAERLLSVYLLRHVNDYRIAFADKRFYE